MRTSYQPSLSHFATALVVAAAFALGLTPANAHSYAHNGIQVGHAWALQSTGITTIACFPLNVLGPKADRLIKASSTHARSISFITADDATLKSIDLLPGKPVPMRVGGLHLLLSGLKQPFKVGQHIPITLTFERAGKLAIELYVEAKPGMSMDHKGL